MIPIHLKNSGLQGYRSSEIGSNLEQFWTQIVMVEIDKRTYLVYCKIFVFAISKNRSVPASQNLKE